MRVLVIPHAYSRQLAVREIELARCWARRHTVYVVRPPLLDGQAGFFGKARFHVSALRSSVERPQQGYGWIVVPALYRMAALQPAVNRLTVRWLLAKFRFDVVVNASYLGSGARPGQIGVSVPRGSYQYIYDLVDDHAGGHRLYGGAIEAQAADQVVCREIAKADRVVTVSSYLGDLCRTRYGREAVVVPNGFHPPTACGDGNRPLRKKLGLGTGPVLGYLGSLDQWVDIGFAVAVFQRLRGGNPRVQFLVVGGGERQEQAEAEYKEVPGLKFAGWVPRCKVESYFQLIDVGLIPFEENDLTHAALPIKALEYGAHGKPVVASRLAGLMGLNLSYVRCQPMRVNVWTAQIQELLSIPCAKPLHEELSRYRWDVLARRFEDLF